jgi:ribosomal protein S12 methylthiotransferase
MISLGCAKNLVDAEVMLGALLQDGLEITNDAGQADVLIVNTCSFIDSAQEESVDAILEAAELRQDRNRKQALIVSGCLPQRFRDDLPGLLPEVDAFMGVDQVARVSEIVKQAMAQRAAKLHEGQGEKGEGRRQKTAARVAGLKAEGRRQKREVVGRLAASNSRREATVGPKTGRIHPLERSGKAKKVWPDDSDSPFPLPPSHLLTVTRRPTYIPDYATPRLRLTPRHYVYLKIAEGCNHPCSFCAIPRMRGSHRSRPQADVVAEAKALLADGVRELNLISQDSTYYGLDLRPNHSRAIASPERFEAAVRSMPVWSTTICTLLRELNALPGDFWIRLLYTHPAHWTDEVIQTIADCPKVARYADIPLQHIHPNMLERMRRETSRQHIVGLLKRIRAGIPGIALRTTFIVGFPGETEEYFQSLLDFIGEMKFERLGVFAYSREEGTRAGAMAGQHPDQVKRRRRALVMAAQREVTREVSRSFVGRTIKVLIERPADSRQLPGANSGSWEHGFSRERQSQISNLNSQTYLVARGEADAPDIDGRVYVRGRLPLGRFSSVKIVAHTDYDLVAVPE